jgi:hypothetical protein
MSINGDCINEALSALSVSNDGLEIMKDDRISPESLLYKVCICIYPYVLSMFIKYPYVLL